MKKKPLSLQVKALDSLIQESHQFHGQVIYANLGPVIAEKKPVFRIILTAVRVASRMRFLNMMMVASIIMGYRILREPKKNISIFQYGMSENNVSAFQRLNQCLDPEIRGKAGINGHRIPFLERLKTAFSLRRLWQAGGALTARRHARPLAHLQSVLAAAAALLYAQRPLDNDIEIVCISCDHSPICMAALAAARRQGKATCYMQHAPVTEYFPPLNYDLSVLFDRASVDAYRKAAERLNMPFNEDAITILPPFAETFRMPQVDALPYRIGICLSFFPNMSRIEDLVASLSARTDVAGISLRRHPRCRHDWSNFAVMSKVDLRSQDEAGVDFFASVDIALVSNSGVAIEAMHYGRPTFFVQGADSLPDDYYGFVADGVLPIFSVETLNAPTLFFDAAWQKRFAQYDETAITPLADLRENTRRVFMEILTKASTE